MARELAEALASHAKSTVVAVPAAAVGVQSGTELSPRRLWAPGDGDPAGVEIGPAKLAEVQSLLIVAVIAAGALVPVQAAINARLGQAAGHPLWAGVWNFALGLIVLVTIAGFAAPRPALSNAWQSVPSWGWLGGLCGAMLVVTALIAAPRLGASLLVAGLVCGQLCASLMLDHWALLGYRAQPISPTKLAGVALLLAGMWLIRKN